MSNQFNFASFEFQFKGGVVWAELIVFASVNFALKMRYMQDYGMRIYDPRVGGLNVDSLENTIYGIHHFNLPEMAHYSQMI